MVNATAAVILSGMEKISERILYFPPEPEFDRPLLGYIRGDKFSVAIDAGSSGPHVASFYSTLKQEGLPLPSLTVLTHSHWDHSFGLYAIHGLSIANARTEKHLAKIIEKDKDDLYQSYISEDYSYMRKEYERAENIIVANADIVFNSYLLLDAGNIRIELIHTESPHTDDSTLIYIPSERVLFTGDATSGEILSDSDLETGGIYRKKELEAFISTLKQINARTIVHSHMGPVAAEEEISYLEKLLAGLQTN